MDKALNYLALARKAGRIELGEEPVGAAARAQHARLIVVAGDAGDHTWRRAKSFAAGTKDDMGMVTGRSALAIAAFTDPAMALAFVKALGQPEQNKELLENLDKRTARIRQRQKEAKAHERNKQLGRKKH